ncbi:MAG TPA: hypothetical protein VHS96_02545, partial [Bacteroidia bacterium]|nr:hypothetical protein [Bacteroidia bacterium]
FFAEAIHAWTFGQLDFALSINSDKGRLAKDCAVMRVPAKTRRATKRMGLMGIRILRATSSIPKFRKNP